VHDLAGLDAPRRQLPDLLEPDRVDLRVAAGLQVEGVGELLGEGAARALAEDGDAGTDVDAGLVVRLRLAVLVDPLVARAHADHAAILDESDGGGELGEDVDPHRLDLRRHPLDDLAERDDVVAVVLQRRRQDRQPQRPLLGQVEDVLTADLGLERRLLPLLGEELTQRARVEHGAGERVAADLLPLLEHGDRRLELLAAALVVRLD
jgi:hypothetical protein